MQSQMTDQINAEIEANFRTAVNQSLLLAGAAAIIAAVAVSWLVSRQIVNPLRALVSLSQRIASGHYRERLEVKSRDELAELVRSFNQMAEALDHTETIRSELMADMTHELKTPLASIKGYMEGLQDGVIPPSDETFQMIHHEAARLQRIVQDLQELSRAEAGQVPIHPHPSDSCQIVESAVERMRPQFSEKNIELGVKTERSLPAISADPDRVGQVLINLLGNALQNTAAGGRVEVSLSPAGQMLTFSVQDSGIGIAAENLERIFQRFYRIDKSRARSSGGSGIGLTISRYLVEAHGGRIWAESPGVGGGSTFHFTIPIA
jgi:histidine kinase